VRQLTAGLRIGLAQLGENRTEARPAGHAPPAPQRRGSGLAGWRTNVPVAFGTRSPSVRPWSGLGGWLQGRNARCHAVESERARLRFLGVAAGISPIAFVCPPPLSSQAQVVTAEPPKAGTERGRGRESTRRRERSGTRPASVRSTGLQGERSRDRDTSARRFPEKLA
jgi:hypothetical protein